MALQTFTAGQILTAAQVTALQTNDYNQTVSAKVASYTLVAADKGTRITMSNASATTVTVNTSLFTAGDSLRIQNIGAGACVVTAGTATVTSAGSLSIPQWGGGQLYFTSASAAVWFPDAGTDVGGMTLISTTSLTGASIILSSIPQTYKDLQLVIRNFLPATDSVSFAVRVNGDATANRHRSVPDSTAPAGYTFNATSWNTDLVGQDNAVAEGLSIYNIYDYTNTVTRKMASSVIQYVNATTTTSLSQENSSYYYNQLSAITSLTLLPSSGNFTSGTALLYGIS
jgi:hypothetical protein